MKKGDDVRVAGVTVGEVSDVEIKNRNDAQVTFKVKDDVPMTPARRAEIRFLNLVGDRYIGARRGQAGGREAPRRRDHPRYRGPRRPWT